MPYCFIISSDNAVAHHHLALPERLVDDDFSVWINKLQEGDEQASDVIWKNYFEKLVRLSRNRLQGMPKRAVDEEDIAISAMNSFFRGAAAARFPKLEDRHDLWNLLVTITARKAIRQKRRHFAEKRGGGNVRGESVFDRPDENNAGIGQVLGSEPSPELVTEVSDCCRELMSKLQDAKLETIAKHKLEGFTNDEIAVKLDCTTRTVERKLERIRSKWSREDGTS